MLFFFFCGGGGGGGAVALSSRMHTDAIMANWSAQLYCAHGPTKLKKNMR